LSLVIRLDVRTAFFGNIAMTRAVVDPIADALGRATCTGTSISRPDGTRGRLATRAFHPLFAPLGVDIDAAIDQYELFRDTAETLGIAYRKSASPRYQ